MADSDSWGISAEEAHVRQLGNHSERARLLGRPQSWWLTMYITSHKKSTRIQHLAGVALARLLLSKIEQGKK